MERASIISRGALLSTVIPKKFHGVSSNSFVISSGAGSNKTITGFGLQRLVEALNQGQLQAVREQGEGLKPNHEDALYIIAILVKKETPCC